MSDYTITRPNDFIWIARKDLASGYILSAQGGACARPSPQLIFSKIPQGIRNGDTAFLKTGNAQLFIESVCISYLRRIQRNSSVEIAGSLGLQIRRIIEAGVNKDLFETLSDDERKKLVADHLSINLYEKVVEYAMKQGFQECGGKGVATIAARIKKVEDSLRRPTTEEEFFLSCVSRRATTLEDVPTQKDVYELWYDAGNRPNQDTFRGIRDRLGFAWLPTAKRGKETFRG